MFGLLLPVRLHRRLSHGRHLLVWLQDVRQRPHRRDAELVDLLVTLGVVALDVDEVGGRLAERLRMVPVEIPHPRVQMGVARPDVPDVALEVLHVHDVEADDGRVQADVCFRDGAAVVVRPGVLGGLLLQVRLGFVEGVEELAHGFLVRFLRGGEAGLVDAVVDVVVGPFVGGFDLRLEGFGEEVDVFVLLVDEVVEFGVEHADDLGGFVGHDRVVLFVPEGRHGKAAVVVGVDGEVEVAEVGVLGVEGVGMGEVAGDFVLFIFRDEAPSWGFG